MHRRLVWDYLQHELCAKTYKFDGLEASRTEITIVCPLAITFIEIFNLSNFIDENRIENKNSAKRICRPQPVKERTTA